MLILGALVALMGYAETAAKARGGAALRPAGVHAAAVGDQDPAAARHLRLRLLQVLVVDPAVRLLPRCWSAPPRRGRPIPAQHAAAHRAPRRSITGFANRNFNQGLRAYYFGVAALSWFLHPVAHDRGDAGRRSTCCTSANSARARWMRSGGLLRLDSRVPDDFRLVEFERGVKTTSQAASGTPLRPEWIAARGLRCGEESARSAR